MFLKLKPLNPSSLPDPETHQRAPKNRADRAPPPGDPGTLSEIVREVKTLVDTGIPIFGICLGHQILGQALGGKTFKLKFGHRGGNQPVKDLESGRVEITSQNHGFAVDPSSLPAEVAVNRINLNDQTVEGLRHKTKPVFCVQYHPEAAPGPHDSSVLFDEFRDLVVTRGLGFRV